MTVDVRHIEWPEAAYAVTQTSEDIHDGDVLVVDGAGVVGFMLSAWPIALTTNRGEFHRLMPDAHQWETYAETVTKAREVMAEMGLAEVTEDQIRAEVETERQERESYRW